VKKYRVVPSPLLFVHFWRAALDEAQQIDTPTAKAAIMVRKVATHHRWAISGTPLGKSASNLHGLMVFLGVDPYEDKDIFTQCLLNPAESGSVDARQSLLQLSSAFIWRHRIRDVSDELGIPPLTEENIWLDFDPIEHAYANRILQEQYDNVAPTIIQWRNEEATYRRSLSSQLPDGSLGSSLAAKSHFGHLVLTKQELSQLMIPLLRLRQACVHPQIGTRSLRRGNGSAPESVRNSASQKNKRKVGGIGASEELAPHRSIKSLLQVLEDMISKARIDAEDAQRDSVAFSNGIAGLLWCSNKHQDAIVMYNRVIKMSIEITSHKSDPMDLDQTSNTLRVDPLQRVHAIRNLLDCHREYALLSKDGGANVFPYDLKSLEDEVDKLEDEFIKPTALSLVSSVQTGIIKQQTELLQLLYLQKNSIHASNDEIAIIHSKDAKNGRIMNSTSMKAIASTLEALNEPFNKLLLFCASYMLKQFASENGSESSNLLEVARGTALSGIQPSEATLLAAEGASAIAWDVPSLEIVKMKLLTCIPEVWKVREKAISVFTQMLHPSDADVIMSSNCNVCKADFGKKGPTCAHCKYSLFLKTYLSQFEGHRLQRTGQGTFKTDEKGNISYDIENTTMKSKSGRSKRNKTRIIPGAAGQLSKFLVSNAEPNAPEVESDDLLMLMNASSSFQVPTAMVRVLLLLARACRDMEIDASQLISSGIPVSIQKQHHLSALHEGGNSFTSGQHAPALIKVGIFVQSLLEALRLEAQAFLLAWKAQADFLNILDELKMCQFRMQVVPDDETVSDADSIWKVHVSEVPLRLNEMHVSKSEAELELRKKTSTLKYLNHLYRQKVSQEAGKTLVNDQETSLSSENIKHDVPSAEPSERETCIICLNALSQKVFIIQTCAHRFCFHHLSELIDAYRNTPEYFRPKQLSCPTCRIPFDDKRDIVVAVEEKKELEDASETVVSKPVKSPQKAEIVLPLSGVSLSNRSKKNKMLNELLARSSNQSIAAAGTLGHLFDNSSVSDGSLSVLGSFGTKVEALIKCLKCLLRGPLDGSPVSKFVPPQSLVFSQWEEALLIVEAALKRNNIPSLRVNSPRKASEIIEKFSSDPKAYPILLLPFKSGAEGLNITCCTHVFFLDPSLDQAIEQQASGRVYRIGQTKPTFVHRLLIRNSVEETVFAILQGKKIKHEAVFQQYISSLHDTTSLSSPLSAGDKRDDSYASKRKNLISNLSQKQSEKQMHSTDTETNEDVEVDASSTFDGLTRRDILAFFEAEDSFTHDIETSASTLLQQESNADENTATQSEAVGSENSKAISKQERNELKIQAEVAALNFKFWSSERVEYNGSQLCRLQVLNLLQHANDDMTSYEIVHGRKLSLEVASAIKSLVSIRPSRVSLNPS
jgi:SNF2 family DNA or RNA helicase